jgi:hypothetical protein
LIACDPSDVPFALLYLLDDPGRLARLAGSANVDPGSLHAPREMGIGDDPIWPFGPDAPSLVEFEAGPGGTRAAVILPSERSGDGRPFGFVIAGLSPLLARNASYDRFHKLLAASLSRAVSNETTCARRPPSPSSEALRWNQAARDWKTAWQCSRWPRARGPLRSPPRRRGPKE